MNELSANGMDKLYINVCPCGICGLNELSYNVLNEISVNVRPRNVHGMNEFYVNIRPLDAMESSDVTS